MFRHILIGLGNLGRANRYARKSGVLRSFAGTLRSRSSPSSPMSRGITTVQAVPKRRPWGLYIVGLTAIGAYGYWKWLTHHNFPPSVAELLKEGLWATIKGPQGPDYRKALGKYIEALQEADRLEMVPWSDEYTGIQIIIADLYERLHLLPEAAYMYAEVANTYLIALSKGKIPPEDMDRIITRDLRVALLAGLLMSTDAESFKSAVEIMGPHMIMATREAAKKSEELQVLLHQLPAFNVEYFRDIRNKQLPNDMFEKYWGSYRNELFAMREMMTGIAAASGEYMQALMIKLKTTQMMLTSGYAAGECLLSAANIASLMYLQAVKLKFTRGSIGAQLAEQLEESKIVDDEMPLNDPVTGSEKPSSGSSVQSQPNAQSFIDLAKNMYGEIIETVNSLDQKRTDFIPEAYVMALYGQGVIAVSEGNWELASESLSEARLRAKGSQIESLLDTVENEIAKVEEMKSLSPEEIKKLKPSELPSVDVMFWKLAPDIGDLDRPDLPDTKF